MFFFLTTLFILFFGNYVLSLDTFIKYSNNSNNSYAIVQPDKNVIAFAYDLSSNKGKGIFYNENVELMETELIIETLHQNIMMASISESSYFIVTYDNKTMDLIYVNKTSTEIIFSLRMNNDNYINSLFNLSDNTIVFTLFDNSDLTLAFNKIIIEESTPKIEPFVYTDRIKLNPIDNGFAPCELIGTKSMLCFFLSQNLVRYFIYNSSTRNTEKAETLPIYSNNTIYLKSFSIEINKFLLFYNDDYHFLATSLELELKEKKVTKMNEGCIHHFNKIDSILIDCSLINETMFVCAFSNTILWFVVCSFEWPMIRKRNIFSLNIKASTIKLALFGSRPAIFYTKNNDCYFQLLLHPICENLSFELFINGNVQFGLDNHIKQVEYNINQGALKILIISLPVSGKIGESKTDPIRLLVQNQTYPISQNFIYLSDYSMGTYDMKFAGVIGEDLIGQYCNVFFIVKDCDASCASCVLDKNNCLSCSQGYYPLNDVNLPTEFPCYNGSTKPSFTYLNNTIQKYEYCNTSSSLYGYNSINCVNCKNYNKYKLEDIIECTNTVPGGGYELTDVNYNYYTKCKSSYYYINDAMSYKCAPSNNCEDIISLDRKVKENHLKECVKNCLPDKAISYCEYCTEKSLFLYNNQCIESCPVGYLANITTHTCEINIIDDIEKCIKENCKESVIDILENSITDYNDTNIIIKGNDFIGQIYSTNSSKEDIPNTSVINLGECEIIIRKELKIPQDEKLLIAQMDIFSEDVTPKVKYKVYRENGEEVDLSLCNKIPIEISSPINASSNISIDKAKSISELGYDIYNTENDFYNDICATYSENGYDISLSGRREFIYQNVSFCDSGCQYKGINYDTMKAICSCLPGSNEETQSQSNVFRKELLSININVMKCYKQFLNLNNLKFNIGFYFNFVLFCGDITLFVICRKNEMTKLFSKINYYFRIKSNPPPHKGGKCELGNNKNAKIFNSGSFLLSSFHSINDTNADKKIKQKINSNESNIISSPSFTSKIEKSSDISDKINLIQVMDGKSINQINDKLSNEKNNILFFIKKKDISNYPYNLAIIKDKRSCFSILINIFAEKQMFLRSIFVKSNFELVTLNVSLFLSNLSMYFTLNALFYTDTLINSRFKGELSLIQNLLRSIYSCLVSCVLFSMLNFATSISPLIDMLVIEVKYKKPLCRLTNNAIKIIKKKIIIFYVIEFIFMVVFLYYLSCFCIVYHSTQVSWFLGGLTSFGISLAVCVGVSFGIAVLKTIGLKCKVECLYNLSLFIKSMY